ncbi:STAS domain-containing protein [Streptomyces subrutilus]|uniref:STAS domain-containing protein n=1 Tax=Streptomyces subrutilus TaxID=36818 RepID=UPI0033D7A926
METRTLALEGPLDDVPALCARVSEACRDGPALVVCDVRAVGTAGLGCVEALARMALTARRHGSPLRVTGADGRLRALLGLVGLVELLGEPEEGEPPGGVQEGVEPDDLAV